MYYLDEDGNIVYTEDISELPEDTKNLYEGNYPDNMYDSEELPSDSFSEPTEEFVVPDGFKAVVDSNGDIVLVPTTTMDNFFQQEYTEPVTPMTVDEMADVFANTPIYTIYPDSNSVNVFGSVLNGLDYTPYYYMVADSESSHVLLYFSKSGSVSGNTLHLDSPVTFCNYFRYRPASNTSWQYKYTVSTVSSMDVTLTQQLCYTNMIDGYPDLIPYKQKESYSFLFALVLMVSVLLFAGLKFRSSHKERR